MRVGTNHVHVLVASSVRKTEVAVAFNRLEAVAETTTVNTSYSLVGN